MLDGQMTDVVIPQGERSRAAILDSALSLLSQRGYAGMAISALSKMSGLPASSIYYHFQSKHGVLAAVLERGFRDYHATLPKPSDYEGTPVECFEQWLADVFARLEHKPDHLRLLVTVCVERQDDDEIIRDAVEGIRRFSFDMWLDVLTPVFTPNDDPYWIALVEDLAVLGRSIADGATIANSFDGTTYARHVTPFVAMVKALVAQRELGLPAPPPNGVAAPRKRRAPRR
jgi:AcrR family transcriptional regulator